MKSAFVQRQIPTLLGLGVLIASLVGGVVLFKEGGGVFAPRATAQTTPKNIRITNIKDTSFTVSFLTDDATAGFVKYGKTATDLKTQAGDDRDQLSGSVEPFTSHYITIRDLDADTEYHYTLGTGSVPRHDNNGVPFTVKTAKKGGSPTAAKTIYGTVNNANGTPAEGAIVYMTVDGSSELSGLVRNQGSWTIPLATARTADLTGYMKFEDSMTARLFAQGAKVSESTSIEVAIGEAQPVPPIILVSSAANTRSDNLEVPSQTTDTSADTLAQATVEPTAEPTATPIVVETLAQASPEPTPLPTPTPEVTPTPEPTASPISEATTQQANTVDLNSAQSPTVESGKPTITGKAPPNAVITIEIHSENQIVTTVQTDAQGNFTLPLSGSNTELEPGEHTVTITYTDPATGQQKSEVKTFYVAANSSNSSTLLAQANTSPQPFGSDNPYTIPSPSPSPSLSPSPTASASATTSASPRIARPSTSSAIPKSGSVGMTFALLFGGVFMITAGVWSFYQSGRQHEEDALILAEDDID